MLVLCTHVLTQLDRRLYIQGVDLKPVSPFCAYRCAFFCWHIVFFLRTWIWMCWGREAWLSVCHSLQHSLCILAIPVFISLAWSPVVSPGPHQLPQLKARMTENLSPVSLRTFPGTYTPISGFLGQLQLSNSVWTLCTLISDVYG